jgi:hypothetical protein
MKPNHGREPSPVTTFDANALGSQNHLSCASSLMSAMVPAAAPNGGSGSPRLLRSLIPGTSTRFVRVRSYDRPGRSIVTVLLETSM